MMKGKLSLARKKASRPFEDYYAEWFKTLKNTLLPLLNRSMSSPSPILPAVLSAHVETLLNHFQSYYEALDLAASNDVAQLLLPDWRNSLETPFLWLGDLHPYLFINLLRSFLNDHNESENEESNDNGFQIGQNCVFFDKPWQIMKAWKDPSKTLIRRIDQIECGLRLMVPALVDRARNAQLRSIDEVAIEWVKCEREKGGPKLAIGEAVMGQMDELVSVLVDANRLRRGVLSEIVDALNVYQAALFLERFAQFLVGLGHKDLVKEFKRCKMPLK